MRISDWSSDVCSSDLLHRLARWRCPQRTRGVMRGAERGRKHSCPDCGTKYYDLEREAAPCPSCGRTLPLVKTATPAQRRSAERRVGQECVSTCRSGWSRVHYNNKQ